MEYLKLFLNKSFIFFIIEYFGLAVKASLSVTIRPEHYNIFLYQGSFDDILFIGKCHIFITIYQPTLNIRLHAQQPQVTVLTFQLTEINFLREQKWKKNVYDNKSHILDYYFIDQLLPGDYLLQMEFYTNIDNAGENVFKTSYTNAENETLFATHFYPIGARRMFPCWDDPYFYATFNISIKHNTKYVVLSNMPIRSITIQNDMTWTHFDKTPSMPIYLIAIMISHFQYIIPKERIWYRQRLETEYVRKLTFPNIIVKEATLYLELKWQRCKKLEKVDHVAIPDLRYDSIQNLGLVFYRETAIMYDKDLDPIAHKANVALLIGRQVALQCFGFFNPSWFYHWIHEGIATLFAADAINKVIPNSRMLDLFVVEIQQESLRLDSDLIMKPLTSESNNPSNSFFSFSYYIKAPAILRMLQHVVTEKVFWKGIEIFFNNVKEKYFTTSDDLWIAMQLALNESNDVPNFNVKEKINPWTELKHYPVIKVTEEQVMEQDDLLNHMNIKILFENINAFNKTMEIPLSFVTREDLYFNNTQPRMWLQSFETDTINLQSLNDEMYIIINIQQTGYYRVTYNSTLWFKILNYLRLPMLYKQIHVLNRAQLIDDAFYFLMNGQLPLSIFLDLTQYLKQETDYVAWYPMFKALEYISGFFLFQESAHIKLHMKQILNELLENIKYIEKSDADDELIKRLRQEAAKWACIFDDVTCTNYAADNFKWHFENPGEHKLLPWWKKWVYCNGLQTIYKLLIKDGYLSHVTWWRLVDVWVKADNELLEYLYCLEPYSIRYYLNIKINESETYTQRISDKYAKMQANDRVNSFLLTITKHAKDNIILQSILDDLVKLKPREVSMIVTLINIINNVYSKEQLDKVIKFVKNDMERKQVVFVDLLNEMDLIKKKGDKLINIINIMNHLLDENVTLVKQKIKARLGQIAIQKAYYKSLMS